MKIDWTYKDSRTVDKLESTLEELKEKKSHIMLVDWQQEILLNYIINLQKEISHLRQNKARTLEYIENNRIREKCIVDVNTLEGLLNE